MVNVAELLELKFGNPMKQPSGDNQGTVGADLIDDVRVSAELRGEVKRDEREVGGEEVSKSKVVEGVDGNRSDEGGFMTVYGEERVTEEVVGGLGQIGNELNEINLAVDLSLRRVAEKVGGFEQNGNEFNGVNLVVDLSPSRGSDRKFSNGNGSNVVISEVGKCRKERVGKECRTEMEGNYEVTDLVWGKVRSHPWWPGQIFDLTAASEMAKKHCKKDGFLIAYFGDQTYAWNDASQIKPFRKHFSRMVKQSNTEAFCHAVECALHEVSRRVEFGLACSCLSEDLVSEIKSQVVINTGVSEESRRREGGDRFSSMASFEPAKLIENVKALAVDPFGGIDRLEFVKARAQLTAYHRWKGYYQLPAQNLLNELVENGDNEPDSGKENVTEETVAGHEVDEEVKSGKGKSTARDSYSRKRKHISTDGVSSSKKVKRLLELTSEGSVNVRNKKSVKAGRKRKVVDSLSDDSRDESGTVDKKSLTPPPKKTYKVGENIRRIYQKLSGSCSRLKNGDRSSQKSVSRSSGKPTRACHAIPPPGSKESPRVEVPAAYPPSDEILSQLYLVAMDPMKENSSLNSLVCFFSGFRNYSVEIFNNMEMSGVDGFEDSYWTDRIIQSNPEEQVLFEPEVATLSPNPEDKQEMAVSSLESNGEKPASEYSGTALILNFDKKVSVPSVTKLSDIYTQYGPLKEVSTKNKRAKLVFERRSDAETAFSSAGKYSLFGPSLLRYCLDYYPTPRKVITRARKQTEEKDAALGTAQQEQQLEV